MAEYSKLVLTKKGLGLINKMLAGQAQDVDFTKIVASAAKYTVEELEDLAELPEIIGGRTLPPAYGLPYLIPPRNGPHGASR